MRRSLRDAVKEGDIWRVEMLLVAGKRGSASKFDINKGNSIGWTMLHEAAYRGHSSVVQCLVDHGASLDLGNAHGSTALHLASRKGHMPVVQCLVDYGACLDICNKNGKTVLDVAKTDEIRHLLLGATTRSLLPVSAVRAAQNHVKEAQMAAHTAQNALTEAEQHLQTMKERLPIESEKQKEIGERIAAAEHERKDLQDRLHALEEQIEGLRVLQVEGNEMLAQLEQTLCQATDQHSSRCEMSERAERMLQEARDVATEKERTLAAWRDRVAVDAPPFDESDVCVLLDALGLSSHAPSFREHGVTGALLLRVGDSDLQNDLGVDRLVDRLRLAFHARRLSMGHPPPLPLPPSLSLSSASTSDVPSWDVERVVSWLEEHDFSAHVDAFRRECITGEAIVMLEAEHLRSILGVCKLSDRTALQDAIASLHGSVFGMSRSQSDLLRTMKKESVLEDHLISLEAELSRVRREKREDETIPDEFLCSITRCVMEDPVVCVDGHTYERSAIEDWFRHHDTSPLTGEPLPSTSVFPNHALRKAIQGHAARHGAHE